MRGGHLDICVLGAFQVSAAGDLANWHTGAPDAIPAVGGAMDLAIGAKNVYVMMEHLTKSGESKIVAALHLSADRARLRQPRSTPTSPCIDVTPDGLARGRDRRRPVVRRAAAADRRAARSRRNDGLNAPDLGEPPMHRSLHLRRRAHAVRPLRRRARHACAPTISAPMPLRALMERNPGVDWSAVDDVVYGCANQAGEDNRNVGRMALLLAGLPVGRSGRDGQPPVRLEHGCDRHRCARDQERRDVADDRRRRREHDARAVRHAQGRRRRSRAPRRSRTRPSAGASSTR